VILEPVILEGRHIRLEPLSMRHHAQLCEAGLDEDLWRWINAPIHTPEEMQAYIATALREQEAGTALPFATVVKSANSADRAIGSTRYANIDRGNRRLEIGWTWISRRWQRTAVNTEAKYLMLAHAFEKLGCIRVVLKTDSLNERSRKAILRLGASEEGTFRNHMITSTGRIRHTVWYSIIDSEWPQIRARLERMLAREY
jgi:N-acetyltransferase